MGKLGVVDVSGDRPCGHRTCSGLENLLPAPCSFQSMDVFPINQGLMLTSPAQRSLHPLPFMF